MAFSYFRTSTIVSRFWTRLPCAHEHFVTLYDTPLSVKILSVRRMTIHSSGMLPQCKESIPSVHVSNKLTRLLFLTPFISEALAPLESAWSSVRRRLVLRRVMAAVVLRPTRPKENRWGPVGALEPQPQSWSIFPRYDGWAR